MCGASIVLAQWRPVEHSTEQGGVLQRTYRCAPNCPHQQPPNLNSSGDGGHCKEELSPHGVNSITATTGLSRSFLTRCGLECPPHAYSLLDSGHAWASDSTGDALRGRDSDWEFAGHHSARAGCAERSRVNCLRGHSADTETA